jgi:hypothetical protein
MNENTDILYDKIENHFKDINKDASLAINNLMLHLKQNMKNISKWKQMTNGFYIAIIDDTNSIVVKCAALKKITDEFNEGKKCYMTWDIKGDYCIIKLNKYAEKTECFFG